MRELERLGLVVAAASAWTTLLLPAQLRAQAAVFPVPAAASAPASASAPAATAAAPPATATPVAAPQTVEVTGTTAPDGHGERRRSVASRITYGREELDRMGDSTLGEVLKRLPGVSLSGKPGRGGEVRMRGMGGGYTQILIDGERMARGFSLDEIAPEQIERIEIMRAPVAEFGTRAIAGTINVVMRSDFKRSANELRLGGGVEGQRGQANAAWMANGNLGALGYNLTTTLSKGGQDDVSDARTVGTDGAGNTTLVQRVHDEDSGERESLGTQARLQWRFGPGQSLELQPSFNVVRKSGQSITTLAQPVGTDVPYTSASAVTRSQRQLARLSGTWTTGTAQGGRLQVRFGGRASSSSRWSERHKFGGAATTGQQHLDDRQQRDTDVDIKGKYSLLLADRHSASAGWELQQSRSDDQRRTAVDGVPTLTEFGDDVQARVQRVALYAQDEWDWSKSVSFYLGARWEAITTASSSAVDEVRSRSAVFTPLAHLVWKLPDSRDQVRMSVTRSYRAPDTGQLMARPNTSGRYADLTASNQPTHPDQAGNPQLKPELAWGLELGLEHYPSDATGLLSANLYLRRIQNLIRTTQSLEVVSWATAPRWVDRPNNIGAAHAAGLELEAKGRLADLWQTAPAGLRPLNLRSNLSLMWSQVDGVPGPNNRLKGQPPWTLNLGADGPVPGWPLTLGASLNLTPAYTVHQIDQKVSRQGMKRVLDTYALWRLPTGTRLRLSVSNLSAPPHESGSTTTLPDGSRESTDTVEHTATTLNLRAEFRF